MSESASAEMSEARRLAVARDTALEEPDWAALPDGVRSWRFGAPSGELAGISAGDPAGPRVVLIPGVTGSKEDFVLMLPLLAEAGYFVQSVDLAGQYESHAAGPGASEPYTYDLFIADVIAFLEADAPAHLLGYSFAGIVAQLVAVQRPALIRSLALLATPPATGNVFRKMKVLSPVAAFATPRVGASLMIWGIVTNKNRVSQRRLEFVRARFAYTQRRSVDEVVGLMMQTPDMRTELARLSVPKLVAAGSHDLWPLRQHARFAREIGAEFCSYETGHSPCETTPHQLILDLLELYRRAPA